MDKSQFVKFTSSVGNAATNSIGNSSSSSRVAIMTVFILSKVIFFTGVSLADRDSDAFDTKNGNNLTMYS